VKIKICGITNLKDAETAVRLGADALGFVLAPGSPRSIRSADAAAIISGLPALVTRVGVYVNPTQEEVRSALGEGMLDLVQLHGEETPEFCAAFPGRVLKAIHVKSTASIEEMKRYTVRGFVLDRYEENKAGGTGKPFDWLLGREAKRYGWIVLAGGLTPENVNDAIRTVRPHGIDVSSGVESAPGKKDPDKIRRFIENARESERNSHVES
jgi:phosphoribosylanthranilate isomerase